MTLARIVIAPTAMSPPYRRSDALKQTEITLSLAIMMNGAQPSATHGSSTAGSSRRFCRRMDSVARRLHRNHSTNAQEIICEITVASAAPRTPMERPKMKIGSSTMLHTAPMATVSMPVLAKPCAVMKAFSPIVSCTNSVPSA